MKLYVTERKHAARAHEAFKIWCQNTGTTSPMLSFSQSTQLFRGGHSSSSSCDDEDVGDIRNSQLFVIKQKKAEQ